MPNLNFDWCCKWCKKFNSVLVSKYWGIRISEVKCKIDILYFTMELDKHEMNFYWTQIQTQWHRNSDIWPLTGLAPTLLWIMDKRHCCWCWARLSVFRLCLEPNCYKHVNSLTDYWLQHNKTIWNKIFTFLKKISFILE